MITKFKIYENESSFEIIDIDEIWRTYFMFFNEIYPDVNIRSKDRDIKTICHMFRDDIREILKGKEMKVSIGKGYNGIIEDVWSMYSIRSPKQNTKWSFKFKINGVWMKINNNKINILNKEKSKLEKKIVMLMSVNKFNL